MSLLRVDNIQNRFLNSGPIIVGLTTIAGNLICSGITSITDGLVVSAATTTRDFVVQQSATLNRVRITGIATVGIVTGGTYFGDGVNLSGIVTNLVAGAGVNLTATEGTGKGQVTITVPSAGQAGYANTAGVATDVQGGSAGELLYQQGVDDTSFVGVGTTGFILQANWEGTPTWTEFTSINVSYADSAGISTDIFGGNAGDLVFQSATDTTGFVDRGSTNQILRSQGSSGPEFIDQANISAGFATFSGVSTSVIGGIASVTQLNVGPGVSTFASAVDINADLDVDGRTELDITNIAETLNVVGVSTFASDVDINADLDVDGRTELDVTNISETLNVVGITTLSSDVDINASVDIDGHTELDDLNVSGVSTFAGAIDANGNLDVDGFTELDATNISETLNVVGITTLSSDVDINASIDVDGHTELDNLNVSGVSTFASAVDINADLDVDGHTDLDNVSVSGVATVTGKLDANGGLQANTAIIEDLTDNRVVISGPGGELEDDANLTFNGTELSVGVDLDVDGRTELDITNISETLNVTGISTFDSAVDINADLDVDGRTELDITNISDTLNVVGVSTFSGIATFTSDVFVQPDNTLTVGGGLTVGGASTFVGVASFKSDVFIDGDLNVIGDISYDEVTGKNLSITGIATAQTLDVLGVTTTQHLEVTGITTLGSSNGIGTVTIGVGNTALLVDGDAEVTGTLTASNVSVANSVTATNYFGDGSLLSGITGVSTVTNVLYVNVDGDDANDGGIPGRAKRTVGGALAIATANTVIKVAAGTYSENNPLIMPEQVSIDGDSLRDVSLTPQNADEDFIYVSNGDYIGDVSFTGTLNEGKAIISFNPDAPSFVTAGPYIRNCTNFISNSIGMKIDGNHVIGDTKAMNVDSYTQYNQGGIGVSISNDGYAQLVSIFTICNDQSIVCNTGGQCDLTNSNSSFGRLGLVANGVGAQHFIGTVTTATDPNTSIFSLNVGVNTLGVDTAVYTANTGIVTITCDTDHGFNVGQSVEIYDLEFECDSGSGPSIGTFPSGAYGNIFTVDAVGAANSFSAYIGVSTLSHEYVQAGVVSTFVTRPYDGQVVYLDELYNTVQSITVTNAGDGYGTVPPTVTIDAPGESWGIRATATAQVTDGSVSGVTIVSSGRGYTSVPSVIFSDPDSGTTATGTASTVATYYVINSATPIVNGITTVTLSENVPYAVGVGTTVPFFKQSKILASSHAFEYIGSGNIIATALPQRGGVVIPANEVVNTDGGLVIYTSTDQAGNFKIGDGVIINQQEGSISGDAYTRSLFANITPYILALGGGD